MLPPSDVASSIRLKDVFGFDDSTDAWGVHGVGGFIGSIMTGLFASSDIILLDGTVNPGGAFLNGNWNLLAYNALGSAAILLYSFFGTFIIVYVINLVPGLHFRPDEHEEMRGGDYHEMGEIAYEIIHHPREKSRNC